MKIKSFVFTLVLTLSSLVFGQVTLSQSSPEINWKEINTASFKIIYPDYIEHKAQYIYKLLNHYKKNVGQSFRLVPEKFTLIIRPEYSIPNGFVTLAPKRSEWYSNANITPNISSLEWYQTLAIHEYRHVIQFQNLKKNHMKIAYYLFGELGSSFVNFITQPKWFFEGDAVWAETKYTDGGRGRSPRFSARLKAMLIDSKPIQYDQLIGGNFVTKLPNHYVYGYYFTTRGYNKYGDDFWYNVTNKSTYSPLNPFSFTTSFSHFSQIPFDSFAENTFKDLAQAWKKETESQVALPRLTSNSNITKKMQYEQAYYPHYEDGNIYYIYKNLDTHWQLKSFNTNTKKEDTHFEFDTSPSLSKISIENENFIYTQTTPGKRYAFISSTNLYKFNIKTQKKSQLTQKRRLYNPNLKFNKIVATEFNNKNIWQMSFFDLNGNDINQKRFDEKIPAESIWMTPQKLATIFSYPDGLKTIEIYNIDEDTTRILLNKTRSNIYSLSFNGNQIYFESDYKGDVQIFSINIQNQNLKICTDEKVAAYNPMVKDNSIAYIAERAEGRVLVQSKLLCKKMKPMALNGQGYLSLAKVNNYTNSSPIKLSALPKKEQQASLHNEYKSAFNTHSWSFIGSRGYQIGLQTQNDLGSISLSPTVGTNSSEKKPYANINISYAKYYPIFTLFSEYAERETTYNSNLTDQWFESQTLLKTTLPLSWKNNLYVGQSSLSLDYGSLKTSKRRVKKIHEVHNSQFDIRGAEFKISYLKKRTVRQLAPSFGMKIESYYKDASSNNSKAQNTYLSSNNLSIYLPSLFTNQGFKMSYTKEERKNSATAYRLLSPSALNPANSIFSRGYDYTFTTAFEKTSANYHFPISYNTWKFRDYLYINMAWVNLFYDKTKILNPNFYHDNGKLAKELNSFGYELSFRTLFFRKLPLDIGIRSSYVENPNDTISDFFINLPVLF